MKFTIDRQNWLRGEDPKTAEGSYLYRDSDARMCCLGMIANQCGIGLDDLSMIPCPAEIENEKLFELLPEILLETNDKEVIQDSELGSEMMKVNDDYASTDEMREAKLAQLCAPHGIELEFIN